MIKKQLFEEGNHAWFVLCRDPEKSEHVIDTNEYVIVSGGEGLILDPGGMEIFAQVASTMAEVIPFTSIKHIFGSHQDPDVISSLPLWAGLSPAAKIYVPWMWTGFLAHFGLESVNQFVPDAGIFGPGGHEAPSQFDEFPSLSFRVGTHTGDQLRRGNVVAWG